MLKEPNVFVETLLHTAQLLLKKISGMFGFINGSGWAFSRFQDSWYITCKCVQPVILTIIVSNKGGITDVVALFYKNLLFFFCFKLIVHHQFPWLKEAICLKVTSSLEVRCTISGCKLVQKLIKSYTKIRQFNCELSDL